MSLIGFVVLVGVIAALAGVGAVVEAVVCVSVTTPGAACDDAVEAWLPVGRAGIVLPLIISILSVGGYENPAPVPASTA